MEFVQNLGALFTGGVIGIVFMNIFLRGKNLIDLDQKSVEANKILAESKSESQKLINKVKSQTEELEQNSIQMAEEKKQRLNNQESIIGQREISLDKRILRHSEMETEVTVVNEEAKELNKKTENLEIDLVARLSDRSESSIESIREQILNYYKKDLEMYVQERLATLEEDLKDSATKKAKKILINTMQRLVFPTSVETRAVHVKVQKDHVKGKIIGREGQNVREIEESLDVDIIFNDLPGTISVSAFNLVNRCIAQKTLKKLVNINGEINSMVIQNAIKEATKETDDELYKIGKNALDYMNLKEKDPELTKIIGRLKYRTSYGQNIMKHSQEVGWSAAMLAWELGLDGQTALVGGFLHDLGKAIDQDPDIEDTHDHLSKVLMEKYGYSWEETHAAWTHHDAIPQETAEALLVKAGDAISAGRPGARQESVDRYFERIKALEETVREFDGVKKSFAISAGREVRVIVDPDKIKDIKMQELAKNMGETIEQRLTYPGKIKVNIIRKTEYLETAK